MYSYFVVRKPVKKASSLNLIELLDDVLSVSTTRGRSYNLFVERKWDEDGNDKEIYDAANGSHALWSEDMLAIDSVHFERA